MKRKIHKPWYIASERYPANADPVFEARKDDSQHRIQTNDKALLHKMISFLNAEACGYVVGPEEEIVKINPRNPENYHLDYAPTLKGAEQIAQAKDAIRGVFVLPV